MLMIRIAKKKEKHEGWEMKTKYVGQPNRTNTHKQISDNINNIPKNWTLIVSCAKWAFYFHCFFLFCLFRCLHCSFAAVCVWLPLTRKPFVCIFFFHWIDRWTGQRYKMRANAFDYYHWFRLGIYNFDFLVAIGARFRERYKQKVVIFAALTVICGANI